MPEEFTLNVPAGSFLVVPPPVSLEVFRYDGPGRPLAPIERQPLLVRRGEIVGKIYLRTQPLWHMGWIH